MPFIDPTGSGQQVYDGDAVFAASAAANTVADLDVPADTITGTDQFVVIVTNPSAITALTVVVRGKETFTAGVRYPAVQTITVPANTPEGTLTVVDGALVGEGARIVVSNNTVLGLGQGFTAEVRVRKT